MGTRADVQALARAVPDPNIAYRKSQRSQIAHNDLNRANANARAAVPSVAPSSEQPQAKRRRDDAAAPAGSSTDDQRHITVEAVTTFTAPRSSAQEHMEAEIAQAKQMVVDLRRELQLRSAAGQELEDTGADVPADSRGRKRTADDEEGVALSGGAAKDARVIRTNKKVEIIQAGNNATATKLAWGTVMFGLGVGAAAYVSVGEAWALACAQGLS